MIEIKNADKAHAQEICAVHGLPPCTVYEMTDRGDVLGTVCYEPIGEVALFHYLQASDMPLADALLRAALNAARSDGIKTAQISYNPLILHMQKKGYFSDSEHFDIEIAVFFAKSACKG